MTPWLKKLRARHIWHRLLVERLSEPLHLNLVSVVAAALGSIETKIELDLIIRHQHAFAMLNAARKAKKLGLERTTVVEFGVASGAGLMNMCEIADLLTPRFNVAFDVVGFDTGTGMPPPRDYRDHPEHYGQGDFPMQDTTSLRRHLPSNTRLILGPLSETVPDFRDQLQHSSPLSFVSLDVDYFSSSVDALKLFDGEPEKYLAVVDLYVDDLMFETHNSWSGELGAIREFNGTHDLRKIEPHRVLRDTRVFKNAAWISHMYSVHVLDHLGRSPGVGSRAQPRLLENPYLG
jgi:hypothetical protein